MRPFPTGSDSYIVTTHSDRRLPSEDPGGSEQHVPANHKYLNIAVGDGSGRFHIALHPNSASGPCPARAVVVPAAQPVVES